ncbi:F-box/LRR-repeat protein At3g59200-like [Salvia miltiorrhiza]|uniref:F-box/LRR-repeat protein At3g59200-like n=1 Tax=Salvia miltiorrhiza TaxID=226208 RepID=UPI0025AD5C01|nr:F-box/LRR-repeat protein At3g59200-like [Salvia miltiorrhiza]
MGNIDHSKITLKNHPKFGGFHHMGNDDSKIAADGESGKLPEEITANDHSKTAADADGESDKLPQEIIQHIQSLLLEKEAARTSLLSKSWHGAWTTRPNLSFDQSKFRNCVDEFPIFTKKTMQRCQDLNLNIKSFKLTISSKKKTMQSSKPRIEKGNDDSELARELILRAIKLGATDLTIELPFSEARRFFVLPDEVLESKTLVRLSVSGLLIDLERRNKAVACPNLKHLWLSHSSVKGDLVRDLISRCPGIEVLTLTHTRLFGEERRRRWSPSHDQFRNLKRLRLIGLGVELHHCDELWNKSPSLKVLVIWDYSSDHVRICSPSLERITLRLFCSRRIWDGIWNGEFDVPNIQNFKITAGCDFFAPLLKIKSCGMEWEIKGTDILKTHKLSRFSLQMQGDR